MKNLLRLSLLLFVAFAMSFNTDASKTMVVIDAGHGGKDPGVQLKDLMEKEITLAIAKQIKSLNTSNDLEIILLRETDEFKELGDRSDAINELMPDFVISIHANKARKNSVNGVEAYISSQNENYVASKNLAKKLIVNAPTELGRGVVHDASFHLCRTSKVPAVVLEIGYLSNKNDRKFLSSSEGQMKWAKAIYDMILDHE